MFVAGLRRHKSPPYSEVVTPELEHQCGVIIGQMPVGNAAGSAGSRNVPAEIGPGRA
jgi:hypothetical protein